jgi:hypothetical protein
MEGRTVEAYSLNLGEGSVELMAMDRPSNLPAFLHPKKPSGASEWLIGSISRHTCKSQACTNVTSPDHFSRNFLTQKKIARPFLYTLGVAADLSRLLWRWSLRIKK